MPTTFLRSILVSTLLLAGLAIAQDTAPAVPHTFESGDVIKADEMNENFQALLGTIEDGIVLPEGCAAGQVLSWGGDSWTCADDQNGGASEAPALPDDCEAGQNLTWNGSEWACQEPPTPTYTIVLGEHDETDSTDRKSVMVFCPDGSVATGGGGNVYYPIGATGMNEDPVAITYSIPLDTGPGNRPGGWAVTAVEMQPYDDTWTLQAQVICVTY